MRFAILFPVLLATVLAFQNCSKPSETTSSSTKGNGDGYDGKPYINRLVTGLCADGSDVKTELVVSSSDAVLTRKDCAPVSPPEVVPMADVGIKPHNTLNLVYKDRAFDLSPTLSNDQRPTEYLCRGEAVQIRRNGTTIDAGDFIVKQSSPTVYVARGIIARYNNPNRPDSTIDSGEFPITRTDTNGNPRFQGTLTNGSTIDITTDTQTATGAFTGTLTYTQAPNTAPPSFTMPVKCAPRE